MCVCALHACGVWKGVLGSLYYRFCLESCCCRFHAWASWKAMWHDNALPTSVQLYTNQEQLCIFALTIWNSRFCVCVRTYVLHTTSRMSRVFHKSHRLSLFCFLIVLQGIERASRKMDMRIRISCTGCFYKLSHGDGPGGTPIEKHWPWL